MSTKKIDLIDTGIKNIVSAVDPSFGLISTFVNHGIQYFENKRDRTIQKFYEDLFIGIASEEELKYMDKVLKVTKEDGYRLLNAAIADEEEEKAIYFTRLYKYILKNQNINKYKKLNLLKTLKGLSFMSLQLIPEIFVHQRFSVPNLSFEKYMKQISTDSNKTYDINLLIQFGILKQLQGTRENKYSTTDLYEEILTILYIDAELVPTAHNIKFD